MKTEITDILVSVVIPIYNVENYLPQCIDSVIAQTHAVLDIILVDDGSTDSCSKIVDDYALKDTRIRAIHKNNGGLSDARNTGTKLARGKYLFYLDSDDYITKDAIEFLLSFAIYNNCQIVQGGFYYMYPTHLLFDKNYGESHRKSGVITSKEAMGRLIKNSSIKNFAWGKLYLTSLVFNQEFPIGKYFEDSFWQYNIVDKCERYGIINRPLTFYRQRGGSISGGEINNKLLDLIDGNIERTEFIRIKYPALFTSAIKELWASLYDICYVYGNKQPAYREKLNNVKLQYHNEFTVYLTKTISYKLITNDSHRLLYFYNLTNRIINRLKFGRFSKIIINS